MVAGMFAKTAILALYQRIFSISRRSHILVLSGMAFIVVFYISTLIVLAAGCTPRSRDYAMGGWLSPQSLARCHKYSPATAAATGVVGAVIDIYILLLPLFFVWELQTSTKHKIGLAAIFILGSSYVSGPFPLALLNMMLSCLTIPQSVCILHSQFLLSLQYDCDTRERPDMGHNADLGLGVCQSPHPRPRTD